MIRQQLERSIYGGQTKRQRCTGVSAQRTLLDSHSVTDCDIVLQSAVMERYEGRTSGMDEFGLEYVYNEEAKGPVLKPGFQLVGDVDEWEKIPFPDLDARDWEAAAARDTAKMGSGEQIFQSFRCSMECSNGRICPWAMKCADGLLTEPEEMEGWFRKFTDYRCELIRRIAKYYKPDAVMIFDDYGAKESMMFSPEVFGVDQTSTETLVDTAHECGLYYILHGCGYYKPIFPDIVEIGVDAAHPVQVANDPLRSLKQKYGDRITFWAL